MWHHLVNFFNSSFFIGLVTLIVGSFAIFLYKRQKSDFKKRAAQVILLEIQTAEERLKEARDKLVTSEKAGFKQLPEHHYVMPTQSWRTYSHLFVKDFLPNEWESINDFYNSCVLFDEAIKHNDGRFGKEEQMIRHNVHRASYEYAKAYHDSIADASTDEERKELEEQFITGRNNLTSLLTTGKFVFVYTPIKQLEDVERCLLSIDMGLSLSAVGTKLQKLANNRFWIF